VIHARDLSKAGRAHRAAAGPRSAIGTAGQAGVLAWSLAVVMLVPAPRVAWGCALCLAVAVAVYPLSWRRLLRPRRLALMVLLTVPPLLLMGQAGAGSPGPALSPAGVRAALQAALRLVVVLVAVQGFTGAVDVAALAGLFERFGFQGLGFAMGVALNLIPALQSSAANAWHSLWMRGGLRRHRVRALRLLLVTIVCNALRRAEDIALAAEARAFSPELARPTPLRAGRLDRPLAVLMAVALVALCAWP
jgi:energy-coupling factor transporter transmembrane protein EcfT